MTPDTLTGDDDCQFVEGSNIQGKATLMIHTGTVSFMDDKQQKIQTEKKMDDDVITDLKKKSES